MSAPSRDTEIDIVRAEQDIAATEVRLKAEIDQLRAAAGAVLARLQHARAAAQELGAKDASAREVQQRLAHAQLAPFDVSSLWGRSYEARLGAIRARAELAEQIQSAARDHSALLHKVSAQVAADESALATTERTLRERMAKEAGAAAARPPPPFSPRPSGRREQQRVRMQASIDLKSDTNFFSGFSTDLSHGGIFVATVNHVPVGSEVDIAFTLPSGQTVQVRGVVRWSRDVNDRTPEIFPGLGIQFQELPADAATAIQDFVSTREPLFFPD